MSAGKLWCGSCHNPHDPPSPANAPAYYRERCLACHGATLDKTHAAPGRDCVGCHMPQQPARDGGHTAFTDRIARYPHPETDDAPTTTATAWREPDPSLRERNLSLALVTFGLQDGSASQAIEGFRLLNKVADRYPDDPAVLTSLASVLLRAKQPAEAFSRFEKALRLSPAYAPYAVNVAAALVNLNRPKEAIGYLQQALQLDPLLQQAVDLLAKIYRDEGQTDRANDVLGRYDRTMGIVESPSH